MTELWETVEGILEGNWNEAGGYTSPNPSVYPWRWLWDSCFHAVLWSRLRPDRARREMEAIFRTQDAASGFVPHVDYFGDPGFDRTLWGRDAVSTITQPPMYGHTIRVMGELGLEVPGQLLAAARLGIGFLLERRQQDGLVSVVHPWETGCDDSPRWDSWMHHPFSRHGFAVIKGRLLGTLVLEGPGVAVDNPEFRVGSVAMTALVAFNAGELANVTGDLGLEAAAQELAQGLEGRWDDSRGVWVDGGPDTRTSGSAPTLESYLPLLISDSHWERCREIICDPERFDARYGPRQVDSRHPGYRPDGYWRGAAWPQLNYLLWLAARRRGDHGWASKLASSTVDGALASGWSEYWNPETGAGQGARPQSWTGLAALMADYR